MNSFEHWWNQDETRRRFGPSMRDQEIWDAACKSQRDAQAEMLSNVIEQRDTYKESAENWMGNYEEAIKANLELLAERKTMTSSDEVAMRPWADDRERFEFFAASIFGFDVAAIGNSYIEQATSDAMDAWTKCREKGLLPDFLGEEETLRELAQARIGNLRLKQRNNEPPAKSEADMALIDLGRVLSAIEEIEKLDPVTGADSACVTCWVNACRGCKDAIRKIGGSKKVLPATYLLHSGNALPDSSELFEIHTILMDPEDCPPISDTDTMTVKMLKEVIRDWKKMQRLACDFTVVTSPDGAKIETCGCAQMMTQVDRFRGSSRPITGASDSAADFGAISAETASDITKVSA